MQNLAANNQLTEEQRELIASTINDLMDMVEVEVENIQEASK